MSAENPHQRNGDESVMVRIANAAALTISYRVAVLVMVSLVGIFGNRFIAQIDKMDDGLGKLSLAMVEVSTTINSVAKRVDGIEARERNSRR